MLSMESIDQRILLLRGKRVLLSSFLAELYGVAPKVLMQAVKRNIERFPVDFLFRLTVEEANALLMKKLTENKGESLRSQIVTLERYKHAKHPPYAFTQEGVAMLSSVLRSPQAVKVNVEIMRAFVRTRNGMALRRGTLRKLVELERRLYGHDADIDRLFELIRELREEPAERRKIGFAAD